MSKFRTTIILILTFIAAYEGVQKILNIGKVMGCSEMLASTSIKNNFMFVDFGCKMDKKQKLFVYVKTITGEVLCFDMKNDGTKVECK